MLIVQIDFKRLRNRAAFYQTLAAQSNAPADFGANLDALWDWLTAGMMLPATLYLQHTDCAAQQASFAPILAVLKEAAAQLPDQLYLVCR